MNWSIEHERACPVLVRFLLGVGVTPRSYAVADVTTEENLHLASIGDYAMHLRHLASYIGDLLLENVHLGTLQSFIEARRKQGIKTKNINLPSAS